MAKDRIFSNSDECLDFGTVTGIMQASIMVFSEMKCQLIRIQKKWTCYGLPSEPDTNIATITLRIEHHDLRPLVRSAIFKPWTYEYLTAA